MREKDGVGWLGFGGGGGGYAIKAHCYKETETYCIGSCRGFVNCNVVASTEGMEV